MSKKGSIVKIAARRESIMQLLIRMKKVSIAELSERLGVSLVTVRNDLDVLAESGELVRVAGGAILSAQGMQSTAAISHYQEKKEIARKAAALIEDGDTLFINSGTTTQLFAKALSDKRNLNIVTNSLSVATELGAVASFRVILLGGSVNSQYGFTSGADAQEHLHRFSADWAVLSVDGISARGDISTCHAEEAIIDRIMIQRAKRVLVVADHTKIGRAGFSFVERCNDKIEILTSQEN